MSAYLGDIATSQVLYFAWNSNGADGASITRATNGTVSVYKDDSTTQSTTGVTDTEDFDSLTGVHWIKIDTSADGTFYAAGHDFTVVLSGATIDGKTVNAVLGFFSINNRTALRPTTAGRTLDVSSGGEAGVDWANVGSPTTTVALTNTTVKIVGTIDQFDDFVDAAGKVTINATSVTSIWTDTTASDFTAALSVGKSIMNGVSLGTGLTVAAVSGAVGSVTGAVGSVTGAVGSVTGNVGGNVTGSVGSVAAGGISASSIAADAITAAKIADGAIDNATFAADVGSTAIATNVIGIAAKKGVVDALNVDTYAEPGQGTPAATTTLVAKIGYLFKNWRNKKTQTATQWSLLNDDAATVDQKATVADDGTTASKGEVASGP